MMSAGAIYRERIDLPRCGLPGKAICGNQVSANQAISRPLQVYYFPSPNGRKVSIALEEMGLTYEIIPVNILQGEQQQPQFLEISPNNRIPALVDWTAEERGSDSSSPARSCNISDARAACFTPEGKSSAAGSMPGCSGRWPASAPWPGS